MKSIFTGILILVFAIILNSESKAQSTTVAIIIEQPKDVIECEGSLDQYLFVVAAPSEKQYKIAYRWLKDGRPISSWVADFGQLTFDTLRYRMSGLYNAELFTFDPNWTSAYGNSFSYDSARVSPIVSSDKANLYVLQPPSFMKDIEYQIVKKGDDCFFTFDANIYGEHNMDDPTYWTDIQWYKDSIALIDGDRISGSQSSILTINNIKETDYSTKYRVRLTGDCDTIWSNEFALEQEPTIEFYIIGGYPVGPQCASGTVPYRLAVKTDPVDFPVEYQWYRNGKPVDNDTNKYKYSILPHPYPEYREFRVDISWHPEFEEIEDEPAVDQDFYCVMWPKGFKQNKVDNFKEKHKSDYNFRWHKPIQLITDLEEEYTIEEGKPFELNIKGKSNYILYKWLKDGKDYGGSSNKFKIKKTELYDSGIYQVEMSNECGFTSSRKAKVTVTPKQTITDIEDNIANQEISIYPNPLTPNSTLTINPSSSGKVSVMLVDLLGNKLANIFDDNILNGQRESITLNLDKIDLSSGTYYLIIQMGDRIETRKISVVR
jgi:hypothetical protein